MPAQRLPDQHRFVQRQLLDNGNGIGDVGRAAGIPGAPLSGTMPALIDRDDPISRSQSMREKVPFTRMTGQPVQQQEGRPRSAPVAAGETNTISHDESF